MRQNGAPNFWETRTRGAPNLSPTKLQITNGYFVDKCNCAKKKLVGLVVGLFFVGCWWFVVGCWLLVVGCCGGYGADVGR